MRSTGATDRDGFDVHAGAEAIDTLSATATKYSAAFDIIANPTLVEVVRSGA